MSEHNGASWSVSDRRRFVYNCFGRPGSGGWCGPLEIRSDRWWCWSHRFGGLPYVLELDASDPNDVTILRKYTWGLDLGAQTSGLSSIDSVGGTLDPIASHQGQVGGLLATEDAEDTKDYYYLYDANGNVGQVLDASDGSIAAKYEYDAYGNSLLDPTDPNESGPYAADNPFRFSTKYWDDETGLGYWGYRYYSSRVGRWIKRDQIGETAGDNLYSYVSNVPTDTFDAYGLCQMSNEKCCEIAKNRKLDQGDWGGVICCDGRKVSCVWIKSKSGHKKADEVINACRKLHEDKHHDDIDCPPCGISREGWKKGKKEKHEECNSYIAQYKCLKSRKKSTECNRSCEKAIEKDMEDVKASIKQYCPRRRYPW